MILYLFDILTGWVDIASVCLSAHLLIDKLQVYRCSPNTLSRLLNYMSFWAHTSLALHLAVVSHSLHSVWSLSGISCQHP